MTFIDVLPATQPAWTPEKVLAWFGIWTVIVGAAGGLVLLIISWIGKIRAAWCEMRKNTQTLAGALNKMGSAQNANRSMPNLPKQMMSDVRKIQHGTGDGGPVVTVPPKATAKDRRHRRRK